MSRVLPPLRWGSWTLDFTHPLVMGIVNVTPDSFSDGGTCLDPEAAIAHGLALVAEGAAILDVGGESTRPGAAPVESAEELRRILPVIRGLARQTSVPISVDTSKATVMAAALEAGAALINDVTALSHDPAAVGILAACDHPIILMHMQGAPRTMQNAPSYRDVVGEVRAYLQTRMAWCADHGIARSRLLIDPGIGFGKTTAHNLALLRHIASFTTLGAPVVVGVSRKRFIGELTGVERPGDRDPASQTLAAWLAGQGVRVLRAHAVAGTRQAIAILQPLLGKDKL